MYGRCTPPSANGLREESKSAVLGFTSLPLSLCDHRVAILVNQGSDPTVPYQALVIRESAKLFSGFAPWCQKAFSIREPAAAAVYSPDSIDWTPPAPRRAHTIRKMCARGFGARPS